MNPVNADFPSPDSTRLFSHHGVTHGNKAYALLVTWDEDEGVLTVSRDTSHQLHEVKMDLVYLANGAGGAKVTPYFAIREVDYPTGIVMERTYDLFTLVHLLVNITKEEILEIANRDFK